MNIERKTIDMSHMQTFDLGSALRATWGITYRADSNPLGPELFTSDGVSLGRWRADDAGREFLGWET